MCVIVFVCGVCMRVYVFVCVCVVYSCEFICVFGVYGMCIRVCVCVPPAPSSYVSNNHMSIINFSLDYKSREPVMVVCFSSTQ